MSARRASNDRLSSRGELIKLLEYPDRTIKRLVFIIVVSGIRIGASDSVKCILPASCRPFLFSKGKKCKDGQIHDQVEESPCYYAD